MLALPRGLARGFEPPRNVHEQVDHHEPFEEGQYFFKRHDYHGGPFSSTMGGGEEAKARGWSSAKDRLVLLR